MTASGDAAKYGFVLDTRYATFLGIKFTLLLKHLQSKRFMAFAM
jgi:hypothetical protein